MSLRETVYVKEKEKIRKGKKIWLNTARESMKEGKKLRNKRAQNDSDKRE